MTATSPSLRVIRLLPEYGEWPLAENPSTGHDIIGETTPATYGLSESLASDLAEWNAFWSRHFDHVRGWDSCDSRETWSATGEQIAARLRDEVKDFAVVQYQPWPLEAMAA